jgi:hypothetical protein
MQSALDQWASIAFKIMNLYNHELFEDDKYQQTDTPIQVPDGCPIR